MRSRGHARAAKSDLNVVPVFVTEPTHSIGIVPLLEACSSTAPPSERRVSVELSVAARSNSWKGH